MNYEEHSFTYLREADKQVTTEHLDLKAVTVLYVAINLARAIVYALNNIACAIREGRES